MESPRQMSMPREQALEYQQLLHKASAEPVVQTVRKLAALRLETVKVRLLRATKREVPFLQGEAKAWLDIITVIDKGPAQIDTPVQSPV